MTAAARPLSGYRVLDFTNVLAGPFCGHQLAHLGADVVKIEMRGRGDLARELGSDAALNAAGMGVSFLAQNAGKRSLTVNLKHARGVELVTRLAGGADVVLENFRPGVMDRLGVGYAQLMAHNADLVYCAISGFGQDGPLSAHPAYDQVVQGMSGVMDITGEPDGPPLRAGYPLADTIGGLTAAFAIGAALARREGTRGCFIDVSMLESVLSTMGWAVSNWLVSGEPPRRRGNDNITASPSGAFATGDGLLNIAANKQAQFEALCDVTNCADLVEDPRFATREARIANRAVLSERLETALACDSAKDWAARLNAVGVPAGPVLGVAEVLEHPQVASRGLIARFEDVPGVDRDIDLLRTGLKIDGEAPAVVAPPPRLGEHSNEILAEAGVSADEIAELRRLGVV